MIQCAAPAPWPLHVPLASPSPLPLPAPAPPAQLNQTFPPTDEAAITHTLDISSFAHQQWLGQEPEVFPLVIRIECLTAEARSQGRSLAQAPVGDSLPSWINAQTTYCKLQVRRRAARRCAPAPRPSRVAAASRA